MATKAKVYTEVRYDEVMGCEANICDRGYKLVYVCVWTLFIFSDIYKICYKHAQRRNLQLYKTSIDYG